MEKKLYKSMTDKMLAGVCGGLGEYMNVDPTLIRIAAVLISLFSGGIGLVIYIAMAIIVPQPPVNY